MKRLFSAGAILLVMLSVASTPVGAQRGRRGGAAANQGLPLATNTILKNPTAYYGKQITISAGPVIFH